MKDDKILQDELMTDEELDKVAGGNSSECFSISMYISVNDDLRKQFNGDYQDTAYLKKFLHDKLGIDAELNMNEADFYNQSANANKYKDAETGKYITHYDVIHRISSYGFPDLIF